MTVSEPIRLVDFSESMRVFANIVGYGQVQMPGTYSANSGTDHHHLHANRPYPGATQIPGLFELQRPDDGSGGEHATEHCRHVHHSRGGRYDRANGRPGDAVGRGHGLWASGGGDHDLLRPLLPSTINNNTFALFAGSDELSTSIRGRPTAARCSCPRRCRSRR